MEHAIIKGKLDLVGHDSHAVAIIMGVKRALLRAGNPPDAVDRVVTDMKSGDYDHLLAVATEVVEEP